MAIGRLHRHGQIGIRHIIGNAIERNATREESLEILVQLRNGERRAVVQAKGSEVLVPGDAVIIVTTGGKVRVTKAPK